MYEELLPHTLPTESERLDAMARAHDPDARAAIAELDLPETATCLDVGCGRGTMAIWLAQRMPGAKVVAADLDHASFKEHDLSNLALEVMDVRADVLGEGTYDLIHCRALLGFLPTRREVLGRILRALKPGGWFVVAEMDFGRIAAGPSPFWSTFWSEYLEFAEAQDWDLRFGGRLPRELGHSGFVEINAKHIAPVLNIGGDTPAGAEAHTWSLTLATLAPRLIGGGFVSESTLREVLGVIRNPEAWTPGPGFMMATARRPLAGG